jgi:branched-chain amino acid transport system substrate-binding protein
MIGGVGPLTGAYANYGLSVKKGAELAVKEINELWKDSAFQFKLQYEDSQGDPEEASNAYGKLIDDGMKVSLGGVLSGETASIVAAGKKDGIMILTPSGSALSAIAGNNNAFRVCFNDPQQGTISADFIADNGLATKVAVFYQSDLDYSNGIYETFRAQAEGRNLEIVTVQTFTKDSSTDFTTQINAIKASGAELVFIPIYAEEASTFLSQAKQNGLDKTLFGCDGLDGILSKVSDPTDANGLMMLTPFAADSTEADVQAFVTAYKAKHENKAPDQFAADGYDAIYAIKAAIEKANLSKDDVTNFHARLVAAMTQITVDGVTGTMTWTADGETDKAPLVLQIKGGQYVVYGSEQ